MNKKDIFLVILLFVVLVFAMRALFIPNFYTSHDGMTHTARIANFYWAMKEGQFPPMLAPKLFGGLGYPIFIYIYPLPYTLGSIFHAFGFAFTDSFELVIGLSFLLSGLSMYWLVKRLMGRGEGFLAAMFYTWAPYRFSQIYVRGAIAESFAYIFVPLVLLALFEISKKRSWKWVGIGSICLSGLLLSHQLVSLMFAPVIAAFGLLFHIQSKQKKEFFIRASSMAFLGVSISAYIYLPGLFEINYLQFDKVISYYQEHFVTLKQLIHSPWSYGFSMPGTVNDDMSFQVGLTQILVFVLALLIFFSTYIHGWRSRVLEKTNRIASLCIFICIASIALTLETPFTLALWKFVPGISIVDFPWRWLGVTVFSISLLAAWLYRYSASKLLAIALIVMLLVANRNHLRINQTVVLNDNYFNEYQETATWLNEFMPKWRQTNNWQHLESDTYLADKEATASMLISKTQHLQLEIETLNDVEIIINRLYFPGWVVKDNGIKINENNIRITNEIVQETPEGPSVDRSGLIAVTLPPGYHILDVTFQDTLIRRVGLITSILGFLYSMKLMLFSFKSKK